MDKRSKLMTIILYALFFMFIGVIIGVSRFDEPTAIGVIILISILWGFVMGPWAIATLIELSIGYSYAKSRRYK